MSTAGQHAAVHVSGIHECAGAVDRPADGSAVACASSVPGADWGKVLADWWLGSHRLRRIAQLGSAHEVERAGAVCLELRKRQNGQVSEEKDQRHEAPEEREEQTAASRSLRRGSRCCGTWDFAFPGCGDWGPRTPASGRMSTEMLEVGKFPKNTLFCGDAGFVGYPLWSQILSPGLPVPRAGRGATSACWPRRPITRCGKDGLVLCWPKAAMQSGQAPPALAAGEGENRTDLGVDAHERSRALEADENPDRPVTTKCGGESKSNSGDSSRLWTARSCAAETSQRLLAELNWSIMAMAVAELFALKEQLAPTRARPGCSIRSATDPKRRSFANTMRALRSCLRNLERHPRRRR